jgi:hypothetical protein
MTGSWAESKGRSGDSPEFFLFFCKSEANRHFFLFTLINDLSFRALARNRVPLRRDELIESNPIHTAQIYLKFYFGLNYYIV